ncbi:hypothetical protein D3C81_1653350 [compost metagenome]
MRHGTIRTCHPVRILHFLVAIKGGQPVAGLILEGDIQLDYRGIADHRLVRLELEALRFDHNGLFEETIHSRACMPGKFADIRPADLVGCLPRGFLLGDMQGPNSLHQLPYGSWQQLRMPRIAHNSPLTLQLDGCAGFPVSPRDKHLEVRSRQAALAG